MHLYSNSLSAVAIISSIFKSKTLPVCLSVIKNLIQSQNSGESDERNLVFEKDYLRSGNYYTW